MGIEKLEKERGDLEREVASRVDEVSRSNSALESLRSAVEAGERELAARNDSVTELEQRVAEMKTRASELEVSLERAAAEKSQADELLKRKETELAEGSVRLDAARNDAESFKTRIANVEAQLASLQNEKKAWLETADATQREGADLRETFEATKLELQRARDDVERARQQIGEHETHRSRLERELQAKDDLKAETEVRLNEAMQELDTSSQQLAEKAAELENADRSLKQLSNEHETTLADLVAQLGKASSALTLLQQDHDKTGCELRAALASLDKTKEEMQHVTMQRDQLRDMLSGAEEMSRTDATHRATLTQDLEAAQAALEVMTKARGILAVSRIGLALTSHPFWICRNLWPVACIKPQLLVAWQIKSVFGAKSDRPGACKSLIFCFPACLPLCSTLIAFLTCVSDGWFVNVWG